MLQAPVLELDTVKPPNVLLFTVHALEPKLNTPSTSLGDAELEVYVMLPVADWLPNVLPVTLPIVVKPLLT